MNKTVNINLANTAFTIDEVAYLLLKEYLNQLKETFKNTEGSEDIMDDIEARIAELFQERKKNSAYVVNQNDVKNVIEILGAPNEFEEDSQEAEKEPNSATTFSSKKLFRDPDDKYIGGVAAGISHYFGFDPTWIRLIWLVLALFSAGSFILIYLVFYSIVPEAKTTADKLRMKGKPINISTIEKKIREEFEEVSERVKNVDYDAVGGQLKKKSRNFFDFLVDLIGGIVKVALKLVGFLLLFVSVVASLSWCVAFALFFIFKSIDWPITLHLWGNTPIVITLLALAIFIIGMIPLLFLFMLGNLALAPQKQWFGKSAGVILLVIWLVSLLAMSIYVFLEYDKYTLNTEFKTSHNLFHSPQDTLQFQLQKTLAPNTAYWEKRGIVYFKDSLGKTQLLGEKVRLKLKQGFDTQNKVEIIRKASGKNYENALANAKALQYGFNQQQNNLFFPKEWFIEKSKRAPQQKVEIIVWLKNQQVIYLSPAITALLPWRIANNQAFNRQQMAGHFWKMNQEELECLNCDITENDLP